METSHQDIKLTASELSVLFGTYLNDTLVKGVISYFLEHVGDPDTKSCLEYGLELANSHIDFITKIYIEENIPIPVGFTEHDVNVKAQRLYTDELILHYIQNVGLMGVSFYGMAIPDSARHDLRQFFTTCLETAAELFNRGTNISQEKGLYIRSPYIPYPKQTEFVQDQHFLAGWLGDQRALTSFEISFLFLNLYRNTLGSALLTGFSQVAQSKEVRKYMTKGAEIAQHHSAVFGKFLGESNLPTPVPWSVTATDSKEQVFSDKLMMFHTAALNNAGFGFYGASIGGSLRSDIVAAYTRLTVEIGEFAKEGAKLMIDNGWLEKPPTAPNRKDLARG